MQPSRPAENLEPLNFGPDLEPIKEEATPRESVDMSSVDDFAGDARGNARRQVTTTAVSV